MIKIQFVLAIYSILNGYMWIAYNSSKSNTAKIFSQTILGIIPFVLGIIYLSNQ